MKTAKIELITTAFEIEMDDSDFVIIYSSKGDEIFKYVAWWCNEHQSLQDPFTGAKAEYSGQMYGWAKIPFIDK